MSGNATNQSKDLLLSWGKYSDLHTIDGLEGLDVRFYEYVLSHEPFWAEKISQYRQDGQVDTFEYSEFIIALSPYLERFLLELFRINTNEIVEKYHHSEHVLSLRHHFFKAVSRKSYTPSITMTFDDVHEWLLTKVQVVCETDVACYASSVLAEGDNVAKERLLLWCHYVIKDHTLYPAIIDWYAVWQPKRLLKRRVDVEEDVASFRYSTELSSPNTRDNFSLVDQKMSDNQIMLHNDYCATCHDKQVDYCRSGFYQVKSDPNSGYREDILGQTMYGCPIDEKVSEMHWLKKRGFHLGALIAVMIDNPMCAVTGHRICNDCMRSCIYQKNEPVDTPQVESGVLRDILSLPWGVEIYDLLIRWHPLRLQEYLPKAENGYKVAVMGLGPAGFSLVHHLAMQGCTVVGMDGADIQPWPYDDVMLPIRHYQSIYEPMEHRAVLGFGGVCEYGITARWDKNLLKLVYLSLLRRSNVYLSGNIRFGGTLNLDDLWHLGFHHVALALGAGLPKALDIPHSMAKGMRQANDFLMALQLTGSYQQNTFAELSLHLPAVVIGGGLTAMDTATEVQAFYLQMVQLVHKRSQTLQRSMGEDAFWQAFSSEEQARLRIWIDHGEEVIRLRAKAATQNTPAQFSSLMRAWGGVSIVYRRALEDAPAYKQNAHELQSCIDQGITLYTHTIPVAVNVDNDGSVSHLQCLVPWGDVSLHDQVFIKYCRVAEAMQWWCISDLFAWQQGMVLALASLDRPHLPEYWSVVHVQDKWVCVKPLLQQSCLENVASLRIKGVYKVMLHPAKAIFSATGAAPNTAYNYEYKQSFTKEGNFYKPHILANDGATLLPHVAQEDVKHVDAFFTDYVDNGRTVSFCGDLHPSFHGSVVKAIASSKFATSHIIRSLVSLKPSYQSGAVFLSTMRSLFEAVCVSITPLSSTYYHLVIRCPWLAKKALPGHMFKVSRQRHVSYQQQHMSTQAVALKVCKVDQDTGNLHFIFKRSDVASWWLSSVLSEEVLSCMGPTGVRLTVPVQTQQVLLISDTQGLGVVSFYATALQARGHKVKVLLVNIEQALIDYCQALYGLSYSTFLTFEDSKDAMLSTYMASDRVCIQGNARFVKTTYQHLRSTKGRNIPVVGAVHGPMQCMLKGICAQCLQWQIDPNTLERTKAVYACSWQDQPLEIVDFEHLIAREDSCGLQKTLYNLWLSARSKVE